MNFLYALQIDRHIGIGEQIVHNRRGQQRQSQQAPGLRHIDAFGSVVKILLGLQFAIFLKCASRNSFSSEMLHSAQSASRSPLATGSALSLKNAKISA